MVRQFVSPSWAKAVTEGEKFWLLAYVGPRGFVQRRINWTDTRDIMDIWRQRPNEAYYAIVKKFREGRSREVQNSRDGVLAVNVLNVATWFSFVGNKVNKKEFNAQWFKNIDQAIMVCAMRAG